LGTYCLLQKNLFQDLELEPHLSNLGFFAQAYSIDFPRLLFKNYPSSIALGTFEESSKREENKIRIYPQKL
jgi:hypothetical protein